MASLTHSRIAEFDLLAQALLDVNPSSGLVKKVNKSFVVLELTISGSVRNKNAVSVIREGVSFMVPDVEAELATKPASLEAKRSESFPRLLFPKLDPQQVETNKAYFARLIDKAKLESEDLQKSRKR